VNDIVFCGRECLFSSRNLLALKFFFFFWHAFCLKWCIVQLLFYFHLGYVINFP